jgi:aspartate kinase
MALIVQKFGGTSVGSVERIEQVADKVKKFREAGDDLVVVLSAMSGETNRLIDLAKQRRRSAGSSRAGCDRFHR